MLDVIVVRAAIVTCVADPDAVEAVVRATSGGSAFRIAPDEAMLLGHPDRVDRLRTGAAGTATRLDDDALVVDASDGWCGWTLEGARAREAFERLSQVPLAADGLLQGDVAHVPARVVVEREAIHVFVPAMWREHVRARIVADCASIGVRERADERAWEPST